MFETELLGKLTEQNTLLARIAEALEPKIAPNPMDMPSTEALNARAEYNRQHAVTLWPHLDLMEDGTYEDTLRERRVVKAFTPYGYVLYCEEPHPKGVTGWGKCLEDYGHTGLHINASGDGWE